MNKDKFFKGAKLGLYTGLVLSIAFLTIKLSKVNNEVQQQKEVIKQQQELLTSIVELDGERFKILQDMNNRLKECESNNTEIIDIIYKMIKK